MRIATQQIQHCSLLSLPVVRHEYRCLGFADDAPKTALGHCNPSLLVSDKEMFCTMAWHRTLAADSPGSQKKGSCDLRFGEQLLPMQLGSFGYHGAMARRHQVT